MRKPDAAIAAELAMEETPEALQLEGCRLSIWAGGPYLVRVRTPEGVVTVKVSEKRVAEERARQDADQTRLNWRRTP